MTQLNHLINNKNFKKLRLSGFVLLIILADVRIGLGGRVPIPVSKRKEDSIEIKVELTEDQKDNNESIEFNLKQSSVKNIKTTIFEVNNYKLSILAL